MTSLSYVKKGKLGVVVHTYILSIQRIKQGHPHTFQISLDDRARPSQHRLEQERGSHLHGVRDQHP